jgi:uncharacterized protein YbjT (DUF2867 family)
MAERAVVTGAFSFTGRYIAERLLAREYEVRTLTRRPGRTHPLAARVEAHPYRFDDPRALVESLRGALLLVNTYWIRYPTAETTFEGAVDNTRRLLAAAEEAAVERIVHLSVTNASRDSPYGYFRGKALVEDAVRASRLSHAILRPTLVLGDREILLNNVAYLLRRLPLFAIPDDGRYRVQPVAAEDVADAVVVAAEGRADVERDVAGPEAHAFEAIVREIRAAVGSRARLIHVPHGVARACARVLGAALRDVVVTGDELRALSESLLTSREPPAGRTTVGEWLTANRRWLGREYARPR